MADIIINVDGSEYQLPYMINETEDSTQYIFDIAHEELKKYVSNEIIIERNHKTSSWSTSIHGPADSDIRAKIQKQLELTWKTTD